MTTASEGCFGGKTPNHSEIAHQCFSAFLSGKILAPLVESPTDLVPLAVLGWILTRLIGQNTLLAATLVSAFVYQLFVVLDSFPYTINHHFVELYLIAIVNLVPPGDENDAKFTLTLVWRSILVVFIYSGIHKALGGYYGNGEFMLLYLIGDSHSQLSNCLRWVLRTTGADLEFTNSLTLMAWLERSVIVVEVVLPIVVAISPQRMTCLLATLQLLIAVVSNEWSFAFTSLACILIQTSKPVLWYSVVATLFLCWHFFL